MSGRRILVRYLEWYALPIHLVVRINVIQWVFYMKYVYQGVFLGKKSLTFRKRGFVRGMNKLQGNLTPFLLKSSSRGSGPIRS